MGGWYAEDPLTYREGVLPQFRNERPVPVVGVKTIEKSNGQAGQINFKVFIYISTDFWYLKLVGEYSMKKIQCAVLMVAAIFLVLNLAPPVSAELTKINPGGIVFIGEEGLDISTAVGSYNQIAWWVPTMSLSDAPVKVIAVSNKNAFMVAPADFVGYYGNWYVYTGSSPPPSTSPALIVQDPALDIKVWDLDINSDVSGRSAPLGERLSFRVDTNMYSALNPSYRPNLNSATDGFITIKVKNENNALMDALYITDSTSGSLLNQYIDVQPWFWGGATGTSWGTGLIGSNNQYRYPAGTYTISAESTLNNMKNNYKIAGADYTGKTISQSKTITLVTPAVKIEANKDAIVRGKTFSVTITGKPSAVYYLWIQGTSGMTGASQNQPPMLVLNQANVAMDPEAGPFTIGSYAYTNGGGATIRNDIPPSVSGAPNNRYYARILTSTSGSRTVEFLTSSDTKPASYSFNVENGTLSAIVPVLVQKGAVTIVASGNQVYNRGDIIHFSGTDTETYRVYFFLDNYPPGGKLSDPPSVVTNNDATTFVRADVAGDNTWGYNWNTAGLNLPNGTYTVYAVGFPYDKNNLGNAPYGSLSIVINSSIVAPNTTATTTTTTTTTTLNTTAATTAATTATTVTTTLPTQIGTTLPATQPTGTTARTISPARTTKKPFTQKTPWDATTPAQDTPFPGSFICVSLVVAAILAHRQKE
jgi:hypothetical protein